MNELKEDWIEQKNNNDNNYLNYHRNSNHHLSRPKKQDLKNVNSKNLDNLPPILSPL